MQRQDINNVIREARKIAPKRKVDPITGATTANVTPSTDADYKKYAHPIFGLDHTGKLILPDCPDEIIARVKTAITASTLKKRATAVRYIAMNQLGKILDDLDVLATLGKWDMVERTVTHAKFKAVMNLAAMYPAEYKESWKPVRPRKGKKNSANGLQEEWLEQLIPTFSGQFKIPATILALTGSRPAELVKGVLLRRNGDQLFAEISGAKVTAHAGQETRVLQINHYMKSILLEYMDHQEDTSQALVKVINGNSLTTHIRAKARRLFQDHEQSITSYTLRHTMASNLKRLVVDGQADPDSVSMLLGHRVDKTATFYGHYSKSSNGGMAPTPVSVTNAIKRKLGKKNEARKIAGKIPSQRRRLRRGNRR